MGSAGPLEFDISIVAAPGPAATLILRRNAARRYLVVSTDAFGSDCFLWPTKQADPYGFDAQTGQSFIMLHRAVYGELVTGDWYAWSTGPQTLYIIDAYDV